MVRPREFDEESVLNAARDQFWTTGFAGTSMDAIAAATGLGKGSLYGAFGSKRELFHRVFNDHCHVATRLTIRQLEGDDDQAFERINAYLIDHAAACAEPSRRGCLVAKGTAELAGDDDVVSARSLETFEAIRHAIAAEMQACQRNGDVDPAADPQQLASLLLTVHRGLEALGKAGTEARVLRDIAETALASLPRPSRQRRTPD